MAKAMMTTPEALERWFMTTSQPVWSLFNGHHDKVSQDRSAKLVEQRNPEISMEESFALMIEMINLNSELGGDFTVWSPARNNGTQGIKSYYRVESQAQAAANAKGIAGFPAMAGSGYMSKADVAEFVKKEQELWELRRDMEDMKAAQESQVGVGAMMMNTLLQDGTIGAILQGIVAQLAAKFAPPQPFRAQVSGMAAPAVPAAPTAQGDDIPTFEYSESVYSSLDRMRVHFANDADFETAIAALATQFEAAPDTFKNMLK